MFRGLGVGRMFLKADETIGPWRKAPRPSVCRREPRAGRAPQQMALSLAARDLLCAQDDRVPLKPSVAPQVGPSPGAVIHVSAHTLLEDRGSGCGTRRSPAFRRRQLHAGGVLPGRLSAGSTLSPGLSVPVVSREGMQAGAWGQFRAGPTGRLHFPDSRSTLSQLCALRVVT